MAFEILVQTPSKKVKNVLKSIKKFFKAGGKKPKGQINHTFDADSSVLEIITHEFILEQTITSATDEEFDNEVNERLEAEYNQD